MLAPTLPPIQQDAPLPSATVAPAAQRTRPDAPKDPRASRGDARSGALATVRPEREGTERSEERSFAASLDRASKRSEAQPREIDEHGAPVQSTPAAPDDGSATPPVDSLEPDVSVTDPAAGAPSAPPVETGSTSAAGDAPGTPETTISAPVVPTRLEPAATQTDARPASAAIPAQADAHRPAAGPTTTGDAQNDGSAPAPSAKTGDERAARAEDAAGHATTQRSNAESARPGLDVEQPAGDARISAKPAPSEPSPKDSPAPQANGARVDANLPKPDNDGAHLDPERVSDASERPSPAQRSRTGDARVVEGDAIPEVDERADRAVRTDASERRPVFGGGAASSGESAARVEIEESNVAPRAFPAEGARLSQAQPEPAPGAPSVAQLQVAAVQPGSSNSDERARDDGRQNAQERAAPAQATATRDASAQTGGSQFDLRPGGEIRATPANPAQASPSLTGAQDGEALDDAALASVHRGLGVAMKQQGGSVQMRLTPESLGLLKIEMTIARGVVAATLQASTPEARELLGRHIETLRASLEAKGLSVERLTITLAPASHGGSSGQFNGAGSNAQQQGAGQQATNADPNADHDASGERSRGWFEREQKRSEHSRDEGMTEPDERLFRFRFGLHAIG